jgi:hypothetical protein
MAALPVLRGQLQEGRLVAEAPGNLHADRQSARAHRSGSEWPAVQCC